MGRGKMKQQREDPVDSLRFVLNIFFNRTPSLDPVLLLTVTLNKFKTSNVSSGCYDA